MSRTFLPVFRRELPWTTAGADALERLYRATGQEGRAEELARGRWPSEEELFERGRSGHFGRAGPPARLPLALRPVGWIMGGKGQPESRGAFLANMVTM